MALQCVSILHVQKELKWEVGFEEYLEYVKGTPLGEHAKRSESLKCPTCWACNESVEHVLLSVPRVIPRDSFGGLPQIGKFSSLKNFRRLLRWRKLNARKFFNTTWSSPTTAYQSSYICGNLLHRIPSETPPYRKIFSSKTIICNFEHCTCLETSRA